MRQIWGLLLAGVSSVGCVTPAEEKMDRPVAKLEATPSNGLAQVVKAEPLAATHQGQGFLCLPLVDGDQSATVALGYRITEVQVVENRTNAELIIKRESLIGNIPLKTLHYDSSRYHPDHTNPYGEWDGSEHWLRLQKSGEGYQGRFVYEGEFSFQVSCH